MESRRPGWMQPQGLVSMIAVLREARLRVCHSRRISKYVEQKCENSCEDEVRAQEKSPASNAPPRMVGICARRREHVARPLHTTVMQSCIVLCLTRCSEGSAAAIFPSFTTYNTTFTALLPTRATGPLRRSRRVRRLRVLDAEAPRGVRMVSFQVDLSRMLM